MHNLIGALAPWFLPIGFQGNQLAKDGPGGKPSWPAFEPTTSALQGQRSSTDLPAHIAEAWLIWRLMEVRSITEEVIHPQVPLRIPCYDLAPLAEPGFELAMTASPHPDPTRLA